MLRADNTRLRRLLELSEEQARAAASDQATLTGAPASPVTMESRSADKVRFFFDLFRCRTDIYAVRWENRRDGRSGWMPAIKGYWRKGMNRADTPYVPLTPEVIDALLRGEAHIGLYPLGDDDVYWWVAADFDKEAGCIPADIWGALAGAAAGPARVRSVIRVLMDPVGDRFGVGPNAEVSFPRVRRVVPAETRAVAQFGSALHWGCRGRRFKSCQPDHMQ